jgi:hypothetical protein
MRSCSSAKPRPTLQRKAATVSCRRQPVDGGLRHYRAVGAWSRRARPHLGNRRLFHRLRRSARRPFVALAEASPCMRGRTTGEKAVAVEAAVDSQCRGSPWAWPRAAPLIFVHCCKQRAAPPNRFGVRSAPSGGNSVPTAALRNDSLATDRGRTDGTLRQPESLPTNNRASHFVGALGTRHDRPPHRTAKQCDELPPPHRAPWLFPLQGASRLAGGLVEA